MEECTDSLCSVQELELNDTPAETTEVAEEATTSTEAVEAPQVYSKAKTFSAIVDFTNSLVKNELFEPRVTKINKQKAASSLALYARLINLTKEKIDNTPDEEAKELIYNSPAVDKFINGFVYFCGTYDDDIENNKFDKIPRGEVIRCGDSPKICIEIQKFMYKARSDLEIRGAIRRHLIKISNAISPSDKKRQAFNKNVFGVDDTTAEGSFITETLREVHRSAANMEESDDPQNIMMNLLSNGTATKMFSNIREGVTSGKMNKRAILKTLRDSLNTMLDTSEAEMEEEANMPEEEKMKMEQVMKDISNAKAPTNKKRGGKR